MFGKVLVANRGEIAVRILRTLREAGVRSVAVFSEADAGALHTTLADEAYLVGPSAPAASYLNAGAILDVCRRTEAEALHPGYGFLAESAEFAAQCRDAGVAFVGPSADVLEAMGEKTSARRAAAAAGLPIVPGTIEPVETLDEAREAATEIGYPVAVKATAGGGGIGFRVAREPGELEQALDAVRADGTRFFGSANAYLERYFANSRHVEVQLLGDSAGTLLQLGERDCTVQRRHQKLVEETPGPTVGTELRKRLTDYAVAIGRLVGYTSAGTVEGLLVGDDFYFLEMNTRLQVEHPVTELVTGLDLVHEQLRVAAGEPLQLTQEAVVSTGCAIECRINAEAAHRLFAPSPGTIVRYEEPAAGGVRVDSGVSAGSVVPVHYDSLLAKVVVPGPSREEATATMIRALAEFTIEGVDTLLPFHRALLRSPQWANAETARDLLADRAWLQATAGGP